jgi:uncharacterized protein (DUF362 family)
MDTIYRRDFIKKAVLGGIATAAGFSAQGSSFSMPAGNKKRSQVSLTHGNDRADLTFKALRPYADQVKRAIGSKRIVIKPNNVHISKQSASTHVDTLEGILEFLKSIGKTRNVLIAESAANGPTFGGYENFGYMKLVSKYKVQLVDLDQMGIELVYVFNEKDFHPHPMRTSKLLLDRDNYIISSAVMKTHDRVVATLSLKNIVFGAPIKDKGFSWGPDRKAGAKNDKPIGHGDGYKAINYNLFALAYKLRPDLALIDGFEGMEGNGPTNGTPVDHRICVASPDWLAADRVAVELMGIDFDNVGYLNYCYSGGMGEADLSKIEIIGERLANHVRKYRMSDSYEKQLIWKRQS